MHCVMQADQINWPTTVGNLGLWTEPGIPTKVTHLETHHWVRFFVGVPRPIDFCVGWRSRAGRMGFILVGACKRNQIPPHALKIQKTVMQSVMHCGIVNSKGT